MSRQIIWGKLKISNRETHGRDTNAAIFIYNCFNWRTRFLGNLISFISPPAKILICRNNCEKLLRLSACKFWQNLCIMESLRFSPRPERTTYSPAMFGRGCLWKAKGDGLAPVIDERAIGPFAEIKVCNLFKPVKYSRCPLISTH